MKWTTAIILILLGVGGIIGGCRGRSARLPSAVVPGLTEPALVAPVHAVAAPPIGWRAEPLKFSDRHAHQVWLSPSGRTAYGVIHFELPAFAELFPIPAEWVLRGYLDEMRKDQGEATLISRHRDPDLPGLRFIAEGGLYRTHTNMIISGRHAWAIYVGVLRDRPVDEEEMELAVRAREETRIRPPG